ncbi:GNAT family N-acetyltransferase [Frigidibacter oleivorans]|uniref:GNAT family N-acetyltransferase n=1 Tax=Frigidibacter oleivorans TaxID=2487129 RepID=UPI000F8C39C3|nr:GNAT family N-acyltransferase [Frigidibacter oleivorans]
MTPDPTTPRDPAGRSLSEDSGPFTVRLATTEQDLLGAQRLRYRVFVEELGGDGPLVDHANRFERDEFDPVNDHLLLIDTRRDAGALDHVVGVYRLLPGDRAAAFGRFYCDTEYDLTRLRQSGRRLLELGRSCVDAGYRGGSAMFLLWNGLADYVLDRGIEVLFGVASFHGTDVEALKMPLAWLHHHHLAPEPLRVRVLAEHFQTMDLVPPEAIDRKAAMVAMPALIKAYLRLGGFVGEGAFIDRPFNTTDVCLLMDTTAMSEKHKGFYTRKHERA